MNKKVKIAIPVVAGILAIGTGLGLVAAQNAGQGPAAAPAKYDAAGATEDTGYEWMSEYCGEAGGMMGGEGMTDEEHQSLHDSMMGGGGMMGGGMMGGGMMGGGGGMMGTW